MPERDTRLSCRDAEALSRAPMDSAMLLVAEESNAPAKREEGGLPSQERFSQTRNANVEKNESTRVLQAAVLFGPPARKTRCSGIGMLSDVMHGTRTAARNQSDGEDSPSVECA
jgi:hypothetical protein